MGSIMEALREDRIKQQPTTKPLLERTGDQAGAKSNVIADMANAVMSLLTRASDIRAEWAKSTPEDTGRRNGDVRRRLLEAEHQARLRLDREHLAKMNAQ